MSFSSNLHRSKDITFTTRSRVYFWTWFFWQYHHFTTWIYTTSQASKSWMKISHLLIICIKNWKQDLKKERRTQKSYDTCRMKALLLLIKKWNEHTISRRRNKMKDRKLIVMYYQTWLISNESLIYFLFGRLLFCIEIIVKCQQTANRLYVDQVSLLYPSK